MKKYKSSATNKWQHLVKCIPLTPPPPPFLFLLKFESSRTIPFFEIFKRCHKSIRASDSTTRNCIFDAHPSQHISSESSCHLHKVSSMRLGNMAWQLPLLSLEKARNQSNFLQPSDLSLSICFDQKKEKSIYIIFM